MNDFKRSLSVSQDQLKDRNFEEFYIIYTELLNYLKTIDFNSIFPAQKVTLENYKSLNKQNESSENELSDEIISKIISYINILSKSEYKKYWDSIEIPNRSTEPNYDNLNESERMEAKSQYESRLKQEDSEIRLMHYINELHKKILIYKDHSIRDYYINLCTAILLQYSKSHPKEITKIHFRFKSPKGLATKLAKNIISNGHFERNPETGIDTFKYEDISDAFGAKIVSEKGYYPHASLDEDVQNMINSRDKKIEDLKTGRYEIFSDKIDALSSNSDPSIQITYREYYQKCIDILEKHLKNFTQKEKKVIQYISQQIAYINELIQDADNRSILDENILLEDYKIFTDPKTSYKHFLTEYQSKLSSPLALTGLQKGLNKIFFNSGTTDTEIVENSILSSFGFKVIKVEPKSTSSGHEAIHYDIITPFGKFELQAQDSTQYEFDKSSPTAAHSLMNGKAVTLYKIPKPYDKSSIANPNEFLEIQNSDETIQYYNKNELQFFYENVENLTAKKGKISYNQGLENAQIDLYSSLYNYFSLAMEIPDTHKYKSRIKQFFRTLEEKPFALKKRIFKHTDTISRHINFPEIKSFIFNLRKSKSSLNSNETTIPAK